MNLYAGSPLPPRAHGTGHINSGTPITFTSLARMPGYFCTMRLMFRNATYCISASAPRSVTNGAANFFGRPARSGPSPTADMFFRMTLIAASTTAELACWRRGNMRSMMLSASLESTARYCARESRMKTCSQPQ